MEYAGFLETPLGLLGISCTEDALIGIDWITAAHVQAKKPITAIAKEVILQLQTYFCDGSHIFDLPLSLSGTIHQQQVWDLLRSVPVGNTLFYGDLARQLSSSPRAVGNACRHNPIPIVVPCHRIIAKSGIGGYSGHLSGPVQGFKRWLLQHEAHACRHKTKLLP